MLSKPRVQSFHKEEGVSHGHCCRKPGKARTENRLLAGVTWKWLEGCSGQFQSSDGSECPTQPMKVTSEVRALETLIQRAPWVILLGRPERDMGWTNLCICIYAYNYTCSVNIQIYLSKLYTCRSYLSLSKLYLNPIYKLICISLNGLAKSFTRAFCKMVRKNLSKLFGQPNI